jgi:hypothetical protein
MEYYNSDLGKISDKEVKIIKKEVKDWEDGRPLDYNAYIVHISFCEGIVGFRLSNGIDIEFYIDYVIK